MRLVASGGFIKEEAMLFRVSSWFGAVVIGLLLVSNANAQEDPASPTYSQPFQVSKTAYDVNDIEELFVEGERLRGEDMNILEMERRLPLEGHCCT